MDFINLKQCKLFFFQGAVSAKAFVAVLQTTQSHRDVKTLLLVFFTVSYETGMNVLCFCFYFALFFFQRNGTIFIFYHAELVIVFRRSYPLTNISYT